MYVNYTLGMAFGEFYIGIKIDFFYSGICK